MTRLTDGVDPSCVYADLEQTFQVVDLRQEAGSNIQTRIFTVKTNLNPSSSVKIRGLNRIQLPTFSLELARECSRGRETATKQHHRSGLGVLRNLGRGGSHDPESWSLMDRRAKSTMFPTIVFKVRREQICRARDPLNINIRQLSEPKMLSIIVFKMPHVLVAGVQDTLNIKIEEIVSFGKDELFKRQVTVSPVSPSRSNQRHAKHGSDDAGQNPCSSHVLCP